MPITFQPLSFEQANPLLAGLMQGQKFGQSFQRFPAELQKLQSDAALTEFKRMFEEKKAPLYPEFIQAELSKAKAEPGEIKARTGLYGAQQGKAGAETEQIRYMLEHPGYMAGDEGKLIQYLTDRGMINQNQLNRNNQPPQNQSGGGGSFIIPQNGNNNVANAPQNIANSTNQAPYNPAMPFNINTGNPESDRLTNSILNRPYANPAYQQKMTAAFNWVHSPPEAKTYQLAQLAGIGIGPSEAVNMLSSGKTVEEIAAERGFDQKNMPPPDFGPNAGNITQLKSREAALKEAEVLGEFIAKGFGPYIRTVGNFSPAQFIDALSGMNRKKQVDFLAARMLAPHYAHIKNVVAQGPAGHEASKQIMEKSLIDVQAIQGAVSPDIFAEASALADKKLSEAFENARKAYTVGKKNNKTENSLSANISENLSDVTKMSDDELKKIAGIK